MAAPPSDARRVRPRTVRGPGLFLAQFIGDTAPYDTLEGLAGFARDLGFLALQIPVHDPRILDPARAGEPAYVSSVATALRSAGLVVSEIAAHRAGHALASHPAYDALFGVASDDARRARRLAAERTLRAAIALAAALGTDKVATFSGGLAWPYLYPYPPAPPDLVDLAFAELARRWRPLLDEADRAGVDLCFEIHPGQDLHDGATFERFLALVDEHPRAKILYDPSHLRLQHVDYLGFIDRYHDRIAAFHVKDAEFVPQAERGVYGGYAAWIDRPGRFRSLGDGDIDFGGIFDRLTRTGFDGWAVLEWECVLKNATDGAAEGARFIRDHVIRVGDRAFDAGLSRAMGPALARAALGLEP